MVGSSPPLASSLRRKRFAENQQSTIWSNSGIFCSHNGKRGLVGNIRIATKRRGGDAVQGTNGKGHQIGGFEFKKSNPL
jgi:hypothetical protein